MLRYQVLSARSKNNYVLLFPYSYAAVTSYSASTMPESCVNLLEKKKKEKKMKKNVRR